ncbi:hypothetical protein, partial [Neglectibacter timonensis]|uniref:hypothetical protein n=1 Tax=Neglectibacter timonensis TaxID=1776382 RepID=UPI00248E23DA
PWAAENDKKNFRKFVLTEILALCFSLSGTIDKKSGSIAGENSFKDKDRAKKTGTLDSMHINPQASFFLK